MFSSSTCGGIFDNFDRSELYQTSFLDVTRLLSNDNIYPRSLYLNTVIKTIMVGILFYAFSNYVSPLCNCVLISVGYYLASFVSIAFLLGFSLFVIVLTQHRILLTSSHQTNVFIGQKK